MSSRIVLPFADVGDGITPQDGAKLYFYATGTATAKNTYSDEDLTTANANPVVSDSDGLFPSIWVGDGERYKVKLLDKNNTQQWEADPVIGGLLSGATGIIYETVAAMKAASPVIGQKVTTLGYYTVGDSGAGEYLVEASAVVDGDLNHTLANSNVAIFQGDNPTVDNYGTVGDGSTDDHATLESSFSGDLVLLNASIYQVDTGLVSTDKIKAIYGAWWQRNAAEASDGSTIRAKDTSVVNLLTIESTTPTSQKTTDLDNLQVAHLTLEHKGAGAALLIDNIIRSQVDDLYIDCNNEGMTGVKFDNWGFFNLLTHSVITRFAGRGVWISGVGTQHTITDSHIESTSVTSVAGIETNRPGTIVRGGQINVNNSGSGVGVLFNNISDASMEGGVVNGTLSEYDTGVKITGTTKYFHSVIVENTRASLGSGQKMIIFDRAADCVLLNPLAVSPTGGTVAEYTALAVDCGVVGDYNACRGGMIVHASALRSYSRCTSRLTYNQRADITTDSNLTVTCIDVEKVGCTVHNGVQWDKLYYYMTDDTAVSFAVPAIGGMFKVIVRDEEKGAAEMSYRLDASNELLTSLGKGASVEVTTGALTGTTGTDGAITISPNKSDQLIYIENRLGTAHQIIVIFEGVDW